MANQTEVITCGEGWCTNPAEYFYGDEDGWFMYCETCNTECVAKISALVSRYNLRAENTEGYKLWLIKHKL